MSTSSDFVVIRDPHRTKHPFLVGATDGYYNCATCHREPTHDRHRMTRNGENFVIFEDPVASASRVAVPLTIVDPFYDGRRLADAVHAHLSAVRGAA